MSHKTPAWSYTSLTAYETCPKQYYHLRVKKDFKDTPGEAAIWGQEVHKALELRVKDGTALPEGMTQWEGIAAKVAGTQGDTLTEQQLAINKDFQPTGWFAKDAWCRGVVDVAVVRDVKVTALDWKTGKRKPDSTQLKLFAGLLFAHYPKVEQVYTGFVWLKEKPGKQIDRDEFARSDVPDIWNEFLPRVRRLEVAYEKDSWPARPSGLCKNWCAVTSCEFNGRKK